MIPINMTEWQVLGPDGDPRLAGVRLGAGSAARTADELAQARMLTVSELATGLRIETSSFVGVVSLGPLRISISPKLTADVLLRLFRFAYGLRDLRLSTVVGYDVTELLFRDLIIRQLLAEVKELIARGLLRAYVRRNEPLSSPRGRIDIGEIARNGGISAVTLPCVHHPRILDCQLNQALLAGLNEAARITDDVHLRSEVRCTARLLQDRITSVGLHGEFLRDVQRRMNRLTAAYQPAISLVEILYACCGIDLAGGKRITLPGFLFDMNRFFQALLSRFLHDNLPGYRIEDERRLRGMMSYLPDFNPRRRRSPCPRPDFAVFTGHKLRALLDAKYRDLWVNDLPRDMLYQLVIYAQSMERERRATILYPTASADAREAIVEIREPVRGGISAHVVLRPVDIVWLDSLLNNPSLRKQRESYARRLALGAYAVS